MAETTTASTTDATTTGATTGAGTSTDDKGAQENEGGTTSTTTTSAGAGAGTAADIEAIAAQADKPDAVRNALQAERARAEELARKVKQFEDRDKTEQQKLEERANTAEGRATQAEAKLLRFEVATAKKLPLDLADRLKGETKKDLEADADRLLELVKPNGRPEGDADAGRGDTTTGSSFNDLIRQARR